MKLLNHRPSPAMIVAMLGVFLGLGGVGLAANGQSLILGQSNSASSATSLSAPVAGGKALALSNTSTAGGSTALNLNVAQGHAPLTVNANAGRALNLNADKLDGLDSTAFVKSSTLEQVGPVTVAADSSGNTSTLVTLGPLTFEKQCYDSGAGVQQVGWYLRSSTAHAAYAAVSEKNGAQDAADMSAGFAYLLAQLVANPAGTPVFTAVRGAALSADGHRVEYDLYVGQNVRGVDSGTCVFGGSFILK
jgi:hypothetical protein